MTDAVKLFLNIFFPDKVNVLFDREAIQVFFNIFFLDCPYYFKINLEGNQMTIKIIIKS